MPISIEGLFRQTQDQFIDPEVKLREPPASTIIDDTLNKIAVRPS